MTLIEALLALPQDGAPAVVSGEVAAELRGASTRFVRCSGILWSLTDDGRRLLGQFRQGHDGISQVTVRLIIKDSVPAFDLICDEAVILRIGKADLQRKLQEIRTLNPDVKVVFDFGRSSQAS
jgi:hypothetical protein